MRFQSAYILLAFSLATLLSGAATTARGEVLTLGGSFGIDVVGSAGAGPSTSYFVVDFGNQGGPSYAFAYRYDISIQPVTAQTAWATLVEETILDWSVANFGTGADPDYFIESLRVGDDAESPDFSATGTGWSYWLGEFRSVFVGELGPPFGSVSWSNSIVGMRDRVLWPGSWDGWRVSAFDPISLEPITRPSINVIQNVPEPDFVLFAVLSLTALLQVSRRVPRG